MMSTIAVKSHGRVYMWEGVADHICIWKHQWHMDYESEGIRTGQEDHSEGYCNNPGHKWQESEQFNENRDEKPGRRRSGRGSVGWETGRHEFGCQRIKDEVLGGHLSREVHQVDTPTAQKPKEGWARVSDCSKHFSNVNAPGNLTSEDSTMMSY